MSYNSDRDEAVVAVRATTPLQYVTSVALSLASPRLFDQALPTHRLGKLDVSPELLRGARCIGGLSSEAEDDPEVLRDKLVEWGENLASMTTDLHRNTCEDRDAFRGEIMRSAHGLAGTIAHLLDVAGVDLVREFRLPSSHTHTRLADLAETVSTAITIQSRYGHYAAYRQLYEHRDDKRTSALSPTVDAADPFGEYIGSLVLRGPKAHQLAQHVHGHLSAPAAVHDDAPEVGVRVPIGTPDRTAYAQTVSRMCSWKNLSTTREAVTLYQALAGSPYAVADAIHHLSPETISRQIRLDEVRITLSHLDHQRLLPDAAPSVSKAIAGLLRTDRALTQAELAEEAGVSPRSLRRHLDVLVALDLVRDTDAGYRLSLPFATNKERGRQITPETVGSSTAAPQDLLFDVVMALVENTGRLSDPDDPLSTVFAWPPDYEELRRLIPDVDPWVRIAKTLCMEPDPPSETVSFGMEPQQTSLQDCSGGEPA